MFTNAIQGVLKVNQETPGDDSTDQNNSSM